MISSLLLVSNRKQRKNKKPFVQCGSTSLGNRLSYNIQMMTFTMATGETFERNFMIFLI